ncbi:hypothetical protein [Brevundimonas sp. R86498]|uniref:hypothetical protein n=1 Tax=Brevundimonas sp. R86498 TaxID=3093845 RepID=UPI0037C5DADD
MNAFVRQTHRWLAIVFTFAVLANVAAMALGIQSVWVGVLALGPLILMLISGLWLFALPWMGRKGA